MPMIMDVHILVLILAPQAILAIFMVTLMTGMQPMFIPKNVAMLNGLLHPNKNMIMITPIILNPVQHDHH